MSRTYAILDVRPDYYAEVRAALVAVGYEHALHRDGDGEVIDMHGIAMRADPEAKAITLEDARKVYRKWKHIADNHAQDIVESVDGAQDNQAFRDLAGALADLGRAIGVAP